MDMSVGKSQRLGCQTKCLPGNGLVIVLVVIAVVVIGGFLWYKGGYDKAVRKHESVEASWAQVENQLQRRFDLIPNLVSTVKGYAKHERELFDKIASYRTAYFQAKGTTGKVQAANQLEGALSRLLLLKENYPDLKANASFLRLQDELAGTENRIAVERRRYNESVRDIKTYARTFFGRFFCGQASVSVADITYFEAQQEATQGAPAVEF